MIRYRLSIALVPIPNIFTYNINLITGNQPIMATIFRLLFFLTRFYSSFLWSLFSSTLKKVVQYWR